MPERIVLVHGLWMPGAAMHWFAVRLRALGHATETFGYHSIVGGPDTAIPRLARILARGDTGIVAHSLGGLVALETLSTTPGLPVSRVVCLGTPLCGSGAAAGLGRWPGASLWLGRSAELLRRGCPQWPPGVEVGMVAGSIPRGLGALVAGFDRAHDGTVAVDETRPPGLADHVVIEASHSGLLFSEQAVRLAAAFMERGRFGPAAAGPGV